MSSDGLLEIIAERCDMDEILDLTQMNAYDLVEVLRDTILIHRESFEDYLDIYKENVS
tara:strand:+ start:8722 stop:8895 length:174 start_codon:yes stop_codon:yes gene_type:complete